MDHLTSFLAAIGHEEIEDAEEESFLLFSQDIPSANLGFVDSRATTIDLTIHDTDYTIHQSPTLLSSSRAGGTTGAVLWKITPLIAEWLLSNTQNPLWTHSLLTPSSTIVELGCGISALNALALAPKIAHYIATDQEYVYRLFRQNLDANGGTQQQQQKSAGKQQQKDKGKKKQKGGGGAEAQTQSNIIFTGLDWELDVAGSLKEGVGIDTSGDTDRGGGDGDWDGEEDKGFDVVLSCDCIYNDALVAPLVRTCADLCRLRPVYRDGEEKEQRGRGRKPTVCVIAQQQRSPEVFEAWLQETMRVFRVWRVSDEMLGEKLKLGSGYLVHLLLLK
ncbi:hypothetical protein BO71DRAFT_487759 [Aspergillus ellipticus CBS 707.79]|uniref:Diaminohydroxyphosphoribosylamino-pyrimidine deaminase n=1 Tax=Aspergillus ellipticus CBS 707.79 TaxID=1448320 RepID=A0A319CY59_9EURO|nr:hypothetical protein BO71DRAFT_487759 [Aspergillus ellipticus CBS 707.79]